MTIELNIADFLFNSTKQKSLIIPNWIAEMQTNGIGLCVLDDRMFRCWMGIIFRCSCFGLNIEANFWIALRECRKTVRDRGIIYLQNCIRLPCACRWSGTSETLQWIHRIVNNDFRFTLVPINNLLFLQWQTSFQNIVALYRRIYIPYHSIIYWQWS